MRLCNTPEALQELANKLERFPAIGLDTESSGPLLVHLKGKNERLNLYRSSLTGLSLATPDGEAYYVPIGHRRHNADLHSLTKLYAAIRAYCGHIWIHNLKWELGSFHYGPIPSPLHPGQHLGCTQVGCWLTQKQGSVASPYGLKALTKRHLGMEQLNFEEATKGRDFSELDPRQERTLKYACEDAIGALRLGEEIILPELESRGLVDLFWDIETQVPRVYRHMEDAGMGLDPDSLLPTMERFEAEIAQIQDDWDWLLPKRIKLNSAKDLQWFFKEGHWDSTDVASSKYGFSTEKEYVEWQLDRCPDGSLGYRAAQLKQRHSQLTKLVSTYGMAMLEKAWQYPDQRLHGGFNPTGTATGRPSSSYPNLLNIPTRTKEGKAIRDAFLAREGWTLVSADYSQIELRVLAHLLGKGRLFDTLQAGGDPHQATADAAKTTRDVGKFLNFAIIYGVGREKLARKAGTNDAGAKRIMETLKDNEPGIFELRDKVVAATHKRGYVKTLLGRFRVLPGIKAKSYEIKGHAERAAFNTPIQGGARDIMTLGMLDFYRKMDHSRCRIVCQVYDDLVTEMREDYVREGKALLQDCLENAYKLKVPLVAEPAEGRRWSQHKE